MELSGLENDNRTAPVIVRLLDDGFLGDPIYFPKGDEKELHFDGKRYVVTCHGAGWIGDQLVTCASDVVKNIPQLLRRGISNIGASLRGSLCLYISSQEEQYVFPDPLGAMIVFEYKSPRAIAYSSDLESLVKAVQELGEVVEKNFNYLVELVATGNGGFFSSSYKNVSSFLPFEYLCVSQKESRKFRYSVADEFFSVPRSLDDLFERARNEILENVTAVAKSSFDNCISHLTGGFDSRLILSALTYSGYENKFRFMCSGNLNLPDRRIAGELCGHLGLCLTNSDGTVKSSYQPGKAMFGTSGLLRFDLPVSAFPGHVLMSGGYGECLRSFYSSRNNSLGDPRSVLSSLYGRFFSDDSNRIVSSSFYDFYLNQFKGFLDESLGFGVPADAVLDYMYVAKRNRYYVGLTSGYFSNTIPRVDPLYSLSAIRLGLFTPQSLRSANVQGLRMMSSFNSDLVSLPFDSERISPAYESIYGPVSRQSFNGRTSDYFHDDRVVVHASKGATREQVQKAKEINCSLFQVVHLNDVQDSLRDLLGANRKIVSESMDWKIVNRLLNPNLSNRVHIRSVFALHDSLCWFNS
ncbi:hypothetical protein [Alcaligenes faecalis]|uniref:hypothetical protein n=1 Tax=Alcaligenes faecalis TaxID=511 RepID=UPI000E144079|nr:hypothetical protein [Alcaligenes faecalis]SSY79776.1 Uncharacterised protein [Alcaligenes faecalis subsp. faecalis]